MFDKTGRGLITWRELSSLLKALGIPDIPIGLLNRMSVEFTPENSPGLEYKPFLHLLHSDSFSSTLDYTYNRHNSTYNIRVIKKAISLLVDGFLNLEDLRAARMGFTLYEGETCNGIQLSAAQVTAAMRVTGKAIAPKKLQSWLERVSEDVPGRLQLYEFLDLVKLCNDRNEQTKAIPNVTTTVERSKVGLFELTDPNFLLTPGQKLAKHLDEDYDSMVNMINTQQVPARETLTSAKKSSSSPDSHNYMLHSRKSKRVEEGLDLYDHIRESIKSSTSHVQTARITHSSGSSRQPPRPHSVALTETKSRLPSLRLSTSLHGAGRRSASAPSIRSTDSYQKTTRISDLESVNHDPVPRHLTASAPLMRGGFVRDKTDAFDEGEFALPERRIEKYETLKEYIATNGEAGLSRVITSSIGAAHKYSSHLSPPSSPHFGKSEERKKKTASKPKRAFEDKKSKSFQPVYKDHRLSLDSLANNLEDIINNNLDMTKSTATRKPSAHFDDLDIDLPSHLAPLNHPPPSQGDGQPRPRPRTESPARTITFNLSNTTAGT